MTIDINAILNIQKITLPGLQGKLSKIIDDNVIGKLNTTIRKIADLKGAVEDLRKSGADVGDLKNALAGFTNISFDKSAKSANSLAKSILQVREVGRQLGDVGLDEDTALLGKAFDDVKNKVLGVDKSLVGLRGRYDYLIKKQQEYVTNINNSRVSKGQDPLTIQQFGERSTKFVELSSQASQVQNAIVKREQKISSKLYDEFTKSFIASFNKNAQERGKTIKQREEAEIKLREYFLKKKIEQFTKEAQLEARVQNLQNDLTQQGKTGQVTDIGRQRVSESATLRDKLLRINEARQAALSSTLSTAVNSQRRGEKVDPRLILGLEKRIESLRSEYSALYRTELTGFKTEQDGFRTSISLAEQQLAVEKDLRDVRAQRGRRRREAESLIKDNDKAGAKQLKKEIAERDQIQRQQLKAEAQIKEIADKTDTKYQNHQLSLLRKNDSALKAVNKEISQKTALLSQGSKAGVSNKYLDQLRAEIALLKQKQDLLQKTGTSLRGSITASGGVGGPGGPSGTLPPPTSPDDFNKGVSKAVKEQINLNNKIRNGNINVKEFGRAAALAFKRYAAFLVGTSVIFQISNAFRRATQTTIELEKQLTKIEQVLGGTSKSLGNLRKEVVSLSSTFGTSSVDIATGLQTIAQAGLVKSVEQLQGVASDLAKIPLAPTFGTIDDTVQGLIAIFGQFNKSLTDTKDVLDLVNQFAADFAVESQDIFDGVTRAGAAFSTAGGSLQEFVELFSILRSSTRESAETLGTFFKSGFAQLLSSKSQSQLRSLGVQSSDLVDQLTELSVIINDPKLSNIQRIQIAENLTGERQFSRLLALLREIGDPAIQEKLKGTREAVKGSFDRSIGVRIDDIGVSLQRIINAFDAFGNEVLNNKAIKSLIKDISDLTQIILQASKVITPFIPILATLGSIKAFKIGRTALGGFAERFGVTSLNPFATGTSSRNNPNRFRNRSNTSDEIFIQGQLSRGQSTFGIRRDTSVQLAEIRATRDARLERVRSGRSFQRAGRIAGVAGIAASGLSSIFPENRNARFLGNVGTGAAIGASFGGLPGAAIGAGAGAIKSLIEALQENRKAIEANTITKINDVRKGFGVDAALRTNLTSIRDNISKDIDVRLSDSGAGGGGIGSRGRIRSELEINNIKKRSLIDNIKDLGGGATDLSKSFKQDISSLVDEEKQKLSNEIAGGKFQNLDKKQLDLKLDIRVTKRIADIIEAYADSLGIALDPSDLANIVDGFVNNLNIHIDSDKIKKELQIQMENSGHIFSDMVVAADQFFNNLTNTLKKINEESSRLGDVLSSIITNVNELQTIKPPSLNKDLFDKLGLSFGSQFENSIDSLANQLDSLLGSDIRSKLFRGSNGNDTNTQGELPLTTSQFLSAQGVDEKASKSLGEIFNLLAAFSSEADDTGKDIALAFERFRGSTSDFIKQFLGDKSIEEAAAAVRQRIELENQQLQVNNQLLGNIRELNGQLYNFNEAIRSASDALADRIQEQQDFVNKTGSNQAARNSAGTLIGRANQTSFGNTGQFINELISAAQRRNTSQTATSGSLDIEVFKQASTDLNKYLDLQQQLNQRLGDFDRRISAAAQASDLLKNAINAFESDLQSAGQAVLGFTQEDLNDSFRVFENFQKSGLKAVRDRKEFDSLTKLLSSLGNIDLGKGVTGTKVLGNINQEFGIALAARARSAITGESQGVAEGNIRKELENLKKQQEAAAKLEENLRKEQITLLQAQAQLIPIEQEFYRNQLDKLTSIDVNMQDVVNKLSEFKVPLPVELITGGASGKSGSPTSKLPNTSDINAKPTNKTPVPQSDLRNRPNPASNPELFLPPNQRFPGDATPIAPNILPKQRDYKRFDESPFDPSKLPGQFFPNREKFNTPKDLTDPSFRILPIEKLFTPLQNTTNDFNTQLQQTNDLFKQLNNNINKLVNPVASANAQGISTPGPSMSLEVSPIQVNVALTAPDILSLAGPQLYRAIISKIAPAISQALGVNSDEARNIFESKLPRE